MSNISHKLNTLGLRPMRANVPASHNNYSEQLAKKGFFIPSDYQAFLLDYPLTNVFDSQIVFSGEEKTTWATNGLEVLEILYGECSDSHAQSP
jgi:hypothetical protein